MHACAALDAKGASWHAGLGNARQPIGSYTVKSGKKSKVATVKANAGVTGAKALAGSMERPMIDIERLRELVALMKDADLTEVDIAVGTDSVTIRRGTSTQIVYQNGGMAGGGMAGGLVGGMMQMPMSQAAAPVASSGIALAGAGSAGSAGAAAGGAAVGGVCIESPMVGTCYLTPNPNAAPFVKVGQSVTPDTVVCIIEAMKVFNEIKAEKSGVLEAILVKSGQAVEFGQKMFNLKPN